jgi:ADP-dependent NAD(P)H-hydrate dehydratase / NAD(P)H-hydrate epimerase
VRPAYRVDTVRAAERAQLEALESGLLMQRAATGLAAICASLTEAVYGARVSVLAGSGDNGGDALYAGAMLARRGAVVTAVSPAGKLHEAGLRALRQAGGRLASAMPADAEVIIDGLLGIGGRGGLREPFATLAQEAERQRQARLDTTVVAVDLPSGIDADTGVVDGIAITADVTVTFGAIKPGLLIDPGASHAGTVHLVDIGIAPEGRPAAQAPQREDIAALLPRPGAESDKYRRGVLGLLAGSDRYAGAAVLSAGGAIRGGAGMVRVVTEDVPAQAVRARWPEAVLTPVADLARAGRVQAWVAGPGMGTDDEARARLEYVLGTDVPVLVDADGLTLLAGLRETLARRTAPTLITPHAGELARVLADGTEPDAVEARRLEHARRAAGELGITVLLKGSTTVIATPDAGAPVLVNPTGTAWLATAGSGDVLSGLAGALLAQGLAPEQAAIAAAYLHGLAGRIAADGPFGGSPGGISGDTAGAPIGAHDVIGALPDAIRATTR